MVACGLAATVTSAGEAQKVGGKIDSSLTEITINLYKSGSLKWTFKGEHAQIVLKQILVNDILRPKRIEQSFITFYN